MMNWHDEYVESRDLGERIADAIASFIGSWTFIIIQSLIFVVWVIINTAYLFDAIHFDPYPFILFNLFMSAEAAYSSPLILMSQNRQTTKDRLMAEQDLKTDRETRERIEILQDDLTRIEKEKLDPLLRKILAR